MLADKFVPIALQLVSLLPHYDLHFVQCVFEHLRDLLLDLHGVLFDPRHFLLDQSHLGFNDFLLLLEGHILASSLVLCISEGLFDGNRIVLVVSTLNVLHYALTAERLRILV